MNDNERIREILFPKKAVHAPRYEMFIGVLKEMAQRGEGRWYDMRNSDFIVVGCTEEEAQDLVNRFVL